MSAICDSVMTDGILKILYEFWIIDSYDPNKVDKSKIFTDNKNLVNIKNYTEESELSSDVNTEKEKYIFPDLNLPGVNENTLVNIDGKNYVKDE